MPGSQTTLGIVLVFGSDEVLLETRAMVLENAGFRVMATMDPQEFQSIVEHPDLRLVVLCHSLSAENCEHAIELADARTPALITLLLTAGTSRRSGPHTGPVLSALDGPRHLIVAVKDLLQHAQYVLEAS